MALTRRQVEILRFVDDWITIREYSPSFQEIADHFGLASIATVHEHVRKLCRKGYLRYPEHAQRGLEVVQ